MKMVLTGHIQLVIAFNCTYIETNLAISVYKIPMWTLSLLFNSDILRLSWRNCINIQRDKLR